MLNVNQIYILTSQTKERNSKEFVDKHKSRLRDEFDLVLNWQLLVRAFKTNVVSNEILAQLFTHFEAQ